MRSLLHKISAHLPSQIPPERMFWIVLGILAFGFIIESIVEIFILPDNIFHWLLVIGIIILSTPIVYAIAKAGHVRLAEIVFIVVYWAITPNFP